MHGYLSRELRSAEFSDASGLQRRVGATTSSICTSLTRLVLVLTRSRNDLGNAVIVLDLDAHHVGGPQREDRSSVGAGAAVVSREPNEVAVCIRSIRLRYHAHCAGCQENSDGHAPPFHSPRG